MRCAALFAAAAAPAGAVHRRAATLAVPTTAPSGCAWEWYHTMSCKDGGHHPTHFIADIGSGKTEAECTSACEAASPQCVAVDWAKNGDRRCRLYSGCHNVPHNPIATTSSSHPRPGAYWAGHYNCGGMSWGGVAHVSGDPFTSYNGKKTQFYFPPQVPTKLLRCGDFEFDGRVMRSGVEGDTQQWFDQFRARFGDASVTVGLRDAAQLLPAGVAVEGNGVDVSVFSAQERVAAALAADRQATAAAAGAAPRKLTTVAITVQGVAVTTPAAMALAGGAVNITVAQDLSRRIGTGYVESVDVASDGVGMRMMSSVAEKFTGEKRVTKMHLDLAFTNINASACTGPLPEIWGVRPMSRATAKYLIPHKTD